MPNRFITNFKRVKNTWIPRQSKRVIAGRPHGPNATEAKYLREILNPAYGNGDYLICYEPAPIILTKTSKREYTADFLVYNPSIMRPTYHEVKGSYRLPTHDRARLAWEIAAEHNNQFDFVWAELTKWGWEIERWKDGGNKILVHLPQMMPGEFFDAHADWRRHKPRKSSTWNRKEK